MNTLVYAVIQVTMPNNTTRILQFRRIRNRKLLALYVPPKFHYINYLQAKSTTSTVCRG
jgi:hypothetical protein